MSIKAYITTGDLNATGKLKLGDQEILETLGKKEEGLAIQMQELFTAVSESITATLQTESQLTIEVTGSIKLKGEGGAKFLLFNLGTEAAKEGTMKVVLTTKLGPKVESNKK